MGKRFTDTAIWDKVWYRTLLPAEKVAFNYIKDRCDNVGVWCPDIQLAEFVIGESIDWESFLSKLNSNIVVLDNGKWWLSDFCNFQYGELSDACKPHQSYIKLLKKHRLYKGYTKGIHTLKEKDKEKDKDKVKEKEKEKRVQHGDVVLLTDREYQTHIDKRGKPAVDNKIETMNDWCVSHGKSFADYNRALHTWFKKDENEAKQKLEADIEMWDNPK